MLAARRAASAVLCGLVLSGLAAIATAGAQSTTRSTGVPGIFTPPLASEKDRAAPFNFGFGLNVLPPGLPQSVQLRLRQPHPGRPAPQITPVEAANAFRQLTTPTTLTNGGPNAPTIGAFGPVLPWPLIPVHAALLPDGRVLSFGTDLTGAQGAIFWYDVWDPSQPYASSHTVLPNTTGTDIFCGNANLMYDGQVLTVGGDLIVDGVRNYSNDKVTDFDPATNTISAQGTLAAPRWYASDTPLGDGRRLVAGGRQSLKSGTSAPAEVYDPATRSFTQLAKTTLGSTGDWYYPKLFLASSGKLTLINALGAMFQIGYTGTGAFTRLTPLADASQSGPAIMYRPDHVLSIRGADPVDTTGQFAYTNDIDLSGDVPVVSRLADVPGGGRVISSLAVLADGTVLATGGSAQWNKTVGVSLQSALFDPRTQSWTAAASATQARLYHNISLLLTDGTVLTGGGGAPGPYNQLNAEIYFPPYLFVRGSNGRFAPRPKITSAPSFITPGQPQTLTIAAPARIGRMTLVRFGAITHSTNLDARFIDLTWSQKGQVVTFTAPSNRNVLLPGYWMLFAFNARGVPSVAAILRVMPAS